jgi:hypothetical protein
MEKHKNSSIKQSLSVPQLRFPEFGGELEKRKLVEVTEKPQNFPSKKEKLRAILKKMQEKDIFRSISNPVEWQKRLRNEWE